MNFILYPFGLVASTVPLAMLFCVEIALVRRLSDFGLILARIMWVFFLFCNIFGIIDGRGDMIFSLILLPYV